MMGRLPNQKMLASGVWHGIQASPPVTMDVCVRMVQVDSGFLYNL